MSRCFPFPPPGYEKEPTTNEPDLVKKEKLKEKKHKKDKKEKDKKDSKEKREKHRSEGKHKDKKDKKEKKEKKDKHRHKKKEKEKEKEKEKGKSSAPDEKKVHKHFEGYNQEKLHHSNEQTNEKNSFSSDKEPFLPFQSGEYNEQLRKEQEFRKEKNNFSDEKKPSILFHGKNGEFARNRIKAGDMENFKFVQELDRRIKNEEKGTVSHQIFVDGRNNNFNKVEVQKTDARQAIMDENRLHRNAAIQSKINGTIPPPPLDNKIDRKIEQKENMHEKESDRQGDKRKHKDRDKQRQGKDKDLEKEKKSKEKREQKKAERNKRKHTKNDSIVTVDNLSAHPPEDSFQGAGIGENMKKRKDMETNGFSHENELRPNKMARHISSISPENGRKLVSLQNPGSRFLDSSQVTPQNSFKVSSNGQRVNGTISSPLVSSSAKKPPISSFNHVPSKASPIKSPPVFSNHLDPVQHPPLSFPTPVPDQSIAKPPVSRPKPPPVVNTTVPPPPPPAVVALEPSLAIHKKKPVKAAHPDVKYLNQILTVPKLEPRCGFDEQEWLFSGPTSKKKTMEEVVEVEVWSEAKHIECVDVCALPYVIPY